jgi:hypothetical protein
MLTFFYNADLCSSHLSVALYHTVISINTSRVTLPHRGKIYKIKIRCETLPHWGASNVVAKITMGDDKITTLSRPLERYYRGKNGTTATAAKITTSRRTLRHHEATTSRRTLRHQEATTSRRTLRHQEATTSRRRR